MIQQDCVRLDKWLWAARFYKTRGLAKKAIEGGKVHYNGARSKASKCVAIGATLTITQGWSEKILRLLKIEQQRRAAPFACMLYEETESSIKKRLLQIEQHKLNRNIHGAPKNRPNKKERRQIVKFKNIND